VASVAQVKHCPITVFTKGGRETPESSLRDESSRLIDSDRRKRDHPATSSGSYVGGGERMTSDSREEQREEREVCVPGAIDRDRQTRAETLLVLSKVKYAP